MQSSSGRPVQVLVVDDSAVVREVVRTVLSRDPGLVVASAADPIIAMTKLRQVRPDVIVLDLEMPRMNGLEFLRRLMAEDPIPVVVCSGATGPGTEMALRALEEGAVEVIGKPELGVGEFLQGEGHRLAEVIRAAARARTRAPRPAPARPLLTPLPAIGREPAIIAIGASLGGPEALRQLLAELPDDLPPMVLVQHMPAAFTKGFAERLNQFTKLSVSEAKDGERLRRGMVRLAPGDRHLRIRSIGGELYTELTSERGEERHRPSVDVLFRSLVRNAPKTLAILLTGMGTDGAAGLLDLREAGAHTIAQDEHTSVVFGMPGAAVARGAACEVLPLGLIPGAITSRARAARPPNEVGS